MSIRVGVVGIDLRKLKGEFGSQALQSSGNNFGNMLFTNAVYNQIENCNHIGFHFDSAKVKQECTHIVIPASNWVNKKEDWGFLADLLIETDLPVCVVGLGSQLETEYDIDGISEGTKRFLRVISEKSTFIGVRGLFTKKVLENLGIFNVRALGCPSIFSRRNIPKLREFSTSSRLRIGVGPTRYHLPNASELHHDDKQRALYQFAYEEASSIYYQSEAFEIGLMNREDVSSKFALALNYYNEDDEEKFVDTIMSKGKYHKDLDQWIADVRKDDLYIGTRIHGAVTSILAGTPAILLTHDNRTRELSKIMGVPSFDLKSFDMSRLRQIHTLLQEVDFDATTPACERNIIGFKEFYQENGLNLIDFEL